MDGKTAQKGENMKTVIYIHGKGGDPDEAEEYAELFMRDRVIGMEYISETPWQAAEEFPALFDELCGDSREVVLIANSMGAYFAMVSLADRQIEKAYFISPVVDMERLILDMMKSAGVSEDKLRECGEVVTDFGETLSWEYLSYVREHPVNWNTPTEILYGENDMLTSFETVSAFAERTGAGLTVMPGGEHWFHTDEQMRFLKDRIAEKERSRE